MKKIQLTTIQKLGIVYGVLMILLVIAFVVRGFHLQLTDSQKTSSVPPSMPQVAEDKTYAGKYILRADKSLKKEDVFEAEVFFQADGKVLDGADVNLIYDPASLEALQITSSAFFNQIPRKEMDNNIGLIKVTAFSPKVETPVKGEVSLMTIKFKAKKAGSTQIKFDFAKGETNKSTLVEKGTSRNILGEANGLIINVTP